MKSRLSGAKFPAARAWKQGKAVSQDYAIRSISARSPNRPAITETPRGKPPTVASGRLNCGRPYWSARASVPGRVPVRDPEGHGVGPPTAARDNPRQGRPPRRDEADSGDKGDTEAPAPDGEVKIRRRKRRKLGLERELNKAADPDRDGRSGDSGGGPRRRRRKDRDPRAHRDHIVGPLQLPELRQHDGLHRVESAIEVACL